MKIISYEDGMIFLFNMFTMTMFERHLSIKNDKVQIVINKSKTFLKM